MKGLKPRLVVSNAAISKAPAPPSWLSKEGKAEWKRVAGDLIARKVVTTTDLSALENYCAAVAGVRETARIITRQGRMIGQKPHPAVRQQLMYLESSRRYAAELGLTPVSRQRSAPSQDPGESDEWA